VTLRLQNPTDRDVTLRYTGCFATPSVRRDGAALDWDGARFLCTMGNGHVVVPANGQFTHTFELRAALSNGVWPVAYDQPPEPGLYEIRIEPRATVAFPQLTAQVTVLP
jgi:hypothetical protein